MRSDSTKNYHRRTDLEADAMINEGGAVQQPSMKEAEAAFARLNKPCSCRAGLWREMLSKPMNMFWAGFAAGLAIAMCQNHAHVRT